MEELLAALPSREGIWGTQQSPLQKDVFPPGKEREITLTEQLDREQLPNNIVQVVDDSNLLMKEIEQLVENSGEQGMPDLIFMGDRDPELEGDFVAPTPGKEPQLSISLICRNS